MNDGFTIMLTGCIITSIICILIFILINRIKENAAGLCYVITLIVLICGITISFVLSRKTDPDWVQQFAQQQVSENYCANCNAPREPFYEFCPYCGKEVD